MKAKFILPVMAFALLGFQSCDDDDDNNLPGNAEVEATFNQMFPGVTRVDWDIERGNYYVADFFFQNKEKEAWFNGNGEWLMTETDIIFNDLPAAVQTAYQASEYNNVWYIDDVDMIEQRDKAIIYLIDVENAGRDYDLLYREDGTLIRAVPENETGSYYPNNFPV